MIIPGRFRALDGLRGAAAVAVMGFHVTWTNHLTQLQFFRNGYLSVDLFFILSGFIISVAYDERIRTFGAASIFIRRRFFRIYPLHLFVLCALVALELAKVVAYSRGAGATQPPFTGPTDLRFLLINVFFLQGTGIADRTSWNVPSWSVSAEFVAYLLFAASQIAGIVRRQTVLAAAIAGVAAYVAMAVWFRGLDLTHDFGIVRCLAGFVIGVAIYEMRKDGFLSWLETISPRASSCFEAGALAFTLAAMSLCSAGWEAIAILGFISVIVFVQEGRGVVSNVFASPILHYLGLISYSIYMVHVPIRNVMTMAMQRVGIPSDKTDAGRILFYPDPLLGDALLCGFVVVVLLASALTYNYVERPAREFGRLRRGDAVAPGQGAV